MRILALSKGIVAQNSFFLANRDFTLQYPSVVSAINDELSKVAKWAETHRGDVAGVLAQATGLDPAAWARAVERTDFNVGPVTPAVIAEQQRVADRFFRLGLIPNSIQVKDIVWTWTPAI